MKYKGSFGLSKAILQMDIELVNGKSLRERAGRIGKFPLDLLYSPVCMEEKIMMQD